jgi:hypothetical protein
MGTTFQPLSMDHTHRPIIFYYCFESNLYVLCLYVLLCFVNGEIRTHNLSRAHTLYHYTTISIVPVLCFYSSFTITNRE